MIKHASSHLQILQSSSLQAKSMSYLRIRQSCNDDIRYPNGISHLPRRQDCGMRLSAEEWDEIITQNTEQHAMNAPKMVSKIVLTANLSYLLYLPIIQLIPTHIPQKPLIHPPPTRLTDSPTSCHGIGLSHSSRPGADLDSSRQFLPAATKLPRFHRLHPHSLPIRQIEFSSASFYHQFRSLRQHNGRSQLPLRQDVYPQRASQAPPSNARESKFHVHNMQNVIYKKVTIPS